MSKIFSQTKLVADLTSSERAALFRLLSVEFLGVRHADFTRDLDEKSAVMLLRKDGDGEIVGFSTIMIMDLPIEGRRVKGIFSGDTTVLPAYRNTIGFGVEIGQYFLQAIADFPDHEIYYVLISKGWRTYKILPFFFRHFAPKHASELLHEDRAVIDAFGRTKYPDGYDATRGLILHPRDTQRLVPGSIDAVPPQQPDEHARFFLAKNPGYLSGTELICVARVAHENFTPAMARLIKTFQKIEVR